MQVLSKSTGISTLKSYLLEAGRSCIHSADGLLNNNFVTPTSNISPGSDDSSLLPARSAVGHYLQMYDWDACLFSQASHRLEVTDLPQSVVANFLSLQNSDDGYIPRTISPHRIWDAGDVCKPFLCQALTHQAELDQYVSLSINPDVLEKMHHYLEFFRMHRKHSSGLFHWKNVLESGVDDNLALIYPLEADKDENEHIGDLPDGILLAVDLCTYLCVEYSAFAKLLEANGAFDLAKNYHDAAQELATLIDHHLWNEKLGMYCNLDPRTGQQVELRSWTGLAPALFGIGRPDRTARVFDENVLSEKHFLRPAGIASMAQSEPLCNQSIRGLYGRVIVCNWQGPMWVLPNIFTVRQLLKLKMQREAEEIAHRVVRTLIHSLEHTGTLHENYNAETLQPLWAPNFMSWNILALELIDLL